MEDIKQNNTSDDLRKELLRIKNETTIKSIKSWEVSVYNFSYKPPRVSGSVNAVNLSEVRQLEQEHQEAIEVLDEACTMICKLCVRLNPQHKDCTSCDDLDYLREPILKAKGE